MNARHQMLCTWSGPVFVAVFTIGFWWLAHYLPPPSPNASAADITALYQQNTGQIRLGMLLMMACSGLVAPFVAVSCGADETHGRRRRRFDLHPVVGRHGRGCCF